VSPGERGPLRMLWAFPRAGVRLARVLRWFPVVQFPVARWSHRPTNRSVLARAARCIPTLSHNRQSRNSRPVARRANPRGGRLAAPQVVVLTLCGVLVFAGQACWAQTPRRIDRSVESEAQKLITVETQAAIDRGLAFLAARQAPRDGSFGSSASARRRVAITALSGMAFLSSGSTPGRGKYGTNVQKAVDFLLTRCQPNGFIYDEGNTGGHFGPMYDHGFATLFLGEVYGMARNPQVRTSLERAVGLIVNSQNKEGGWRYEPDSKDADLSVTVCEMMALRAARNSGIYVPKQTIDRCTEYVRKCQTPDGGFRYQLTTSWQAVTFGLTAAGVVTLYSAGIYEGKPLESGLLYLESYRPSASLHQPANHYFYSHYYAAQAMWHAGGQRFEQWYPEIRDELIHGPFPYRSAGGGWRDPSSYGDDYGTAMALLILQTPNNYLPIFQR
jgi:Prenyltransferase and squalene oxidase repeat